MGHRYLTLSLTVFLFLLFAFANLTPWYVNKGVYIGMFKVACVFNLVKGTGNCSSLAQQLFYDKIDDNWGILFMFTMYGAYLTYCVGFVAFLFGRYRKIESLVKPTGILYMIAGPAQCIAVLLFALCYPQSIYRKEFKDRVQSTNRNVVNGSGHLLSEYLDSDEANSDGHLHVGFGLAVVMGVLLIVTGIIYNYIKHHPLDHTAIHFR